MKHNCRRINTASFAGMLAVNALAEALPLGYGSTGAIAAEYRALFAPAPYAFAIWGAIYLLLGLFIVYQRGGRPGAESDTETVGPLFSISCLLNAVWIVAWHYGLILLSFLVITALLVLLSVICFVTGGEARKGFSYLAVDAAFDLYLGWIIAATAANLSVLLVSLGIDAVSFLSVAVTSAMLLAGAAVGAALVLASGRWFASLGILWAYAGVLVRHVGAKGFAGAHPVIVAMCLIGIVTIASAMAVRRFGGCPADVARETA